MQLPAPAKLYCPTGQMEAVADVDPTGQEYPAVHAPLHVDDVRPGEPPHTPGPHGTQAEVPPRPYLPTVTGTEEDLLRGCRHGIFTYTQHSAQSTSHGCTEHRGLATEHKPQTAVVRPVVAP